MAHQKSDVVFADTFYYLALLSEGDQAHERAVEFTGQFNGRILTTAWVLVELGDALSNGEARNAYISLLRSLQTDLRVEIIPPDASYFSKGVDLFAQRTDKNWSLTDCISFVVMNEREITDALTGDRHFTQAGFHTIF